MSINVNVIIGISIQVLEEKALLILGYPGFIVGYLPLHPLAQCLGSKKMEFIDKVSSHTFQVGPVVEG